MPCLITCEVQVYLLAMHPCQTYVYLSSSSLRVSNNQQVDYEMK